jgi:hypothetical protein
MNLITKAQQIKDILEPIPAKKFIKNKYGDGKRCCSLGFIHLHYNPLDPKGDFNGFGARQLTNKFLNEKYEISIDIADINNDSSINGYNESRIKDRVMHLINDMIEAGY